MSPWRRGGDVAGRGAWASRPRSAILTREAAAGRGEALRGEAGCGGEGVPTGAGRDGATRAPGAAARSRGALPRAPQHEDPGGHRWGRGQHVWGRLVAPGNREEKLWAGAEGVQGSPIDPQFWGTPQALETCCFSRRELRCCLRAPISWILLEWCGCCGCWSFLLGPGNLGSPGISGVAESLPVVLSRCTPGAGTCAGRGGRVRYRGPLCSVLRYAVRPVTFTAARAPHRVSGLRDGLEQGVSGEHGTRGPSCTAPPPSGSSLPRPH